MWMVARESVEVGGEVDSVDGDERLWIGRIIDVRLFEGL